MIDMGDGCLAPRTITVQAHSRRLGALELAVFKLEGRWRWLLLDGDTPVARGSARNQAQAQHLAEAAAHQHSTAPALPFD